jgi:ABC-2 type transport system permease protein
MLRNVFLKTMWDRRRSMVWWLLGVAALATLTVAFYPSIAADQEAYEQLIDAYPEDMLAFFGIDNAEELASPEGFVNSQLFANVVPIMLFIFTIGMGTAALAGEEDRRTMDLLLAQPVTRDRVVVDNFAAMAALSGVITAAILLVLIVANVPADLHISLVGLVAANVGAWLLGLVIGALALAIGALTGRRGLTIGLSAGISVAAFFLYGLAPLVEALEPTQKLSPFWWYLGAKPLYDGFDVMFLLMVGWIFIAVAVAVWGFRRRDVSV